MRNESSVGQATDNEKKAILLQAFFNSTQRYQVLLNKRLEIVDFNNCALTFHRTSHKSHLEKGRNILYYINTSLARDFKIQCNKALSGEPVEYEHFVNGGWFNFTIAPLYNLDDEIAGLSIVGNNINNQKKTARIMRRQSEFLSNVAQFQSHQLRHPVSIILGFVNLMKEEENYNVKMEYLHALETATKQLDETIRAIVNEIRAVS